jgi:hypothetical protein
MPPAGISGADPENDPPARRDRGDDPAIDLTGSGPPAEVLDQMARADAINARLRASGRQITFALSDDGCSLQIELRDGAGNLLRILSATEAHEIAAGGEEG